MTESDLDYKRVNHFLDTIGIYEDNPTLVIDNL